MPVSFGRIAALAFFWLVLPCRAAELPSAIQAAAGLSEQAAAAGSPSEANALAFQAIQGGIAVPSAVHAPDRAARRPALTMQSPVLPSIAPAPPAPAPEKPRARRRVLRGIAFGATGFLTGLLFGALIGAGLGLLDMGLRTKEMGKGRGVTRAVLALPAMIAGAIVGQATLWAAGAKFMYDKGSRPRSEAA